MQIVTDEKISLSKDLFNKHGQVAQHLGQNITREQVTNADILLVRTVTKVNAALLKNTNVQFVGTATAGFDHLDTAWLEQAGVTWAHAPGCNAHAVADYVLCCIAALRQGGQLQAGSNKAGVIGVGAVGALVSSKLKQLDYTVIHNDPIRKDYETAFDHHELTDFYNCDLICVHTPLTTESDHPTHHLINSNFLQQLKPGTIVLNAGRGAVINPQAIIDNPHIIYCLDVWENEPNINAEVLQATTIATPHIAGYSELAKLRATWMIYKAACQHFHWENTISFEELVLHSNITNAVTIKPNGDWENRVLQIYNPLEHTHQMKKLLLNNKAIAENFLKLRQGYVLRSEILT